MKLTCCCGASIEVDEIPWSLPRVEFDRRLLSRRNNLECFHARHQNCIEKWRENGVCVPMYTVHCDSSGREMFRRCTTCGGIIDPPSIPYHKGMTLCGCEKPDPYARFRDAIREGKRVFQQRGDGRMYQVIDPEFFCHGLSYPPKSLLIEGVDIPMQPTQEWLDKYGAELNGECGVPNFENGDLCAPRDLEFGGPVNSGIPNYHYFRGRRWKLKRKRPDDGFEKWIDSISSDTLRNALNSDYAARCTVRTLWEAANP